MAQLRVYADATALIGLSRIGRLDLLTLLPGPVYVTTRVWDELTVEPDKRGVAELVQSRTEGVLAVVSEGDPDRYSYLDPGESTVLTAAAAMQGAVIIDERKARAAVEMDSHLRDNIRGSIGVLGLILLAKRVGYLPVIRPLLDDLIHQNFWIGAALYQDVLTRAQE